MVVPLIADSVTVSTSSLKSGSNPIAVAMSSRLFSSFQRLASNSSSSSLLRLNQQHARTLVNRAAARPPPPTREGIQTPEEFLKSIGRNAEKLVSIDSWPAFWKTNAATLREAGVGVKDRRYLLWCMEKYRQGLPIPAFAHPPKPKKKVRGHGPAVQNGKRIKSARPRS